MYDTGYYATGYHATGYYLKSLEVVVTPSGDISVSVSGTTRRSSKPDDRVILQLNQPLQEQKSIYSQLYKEDEEIIALVTAMVKLGLL